MLDYIRAEFYKVLHRPYTYIFLILLLAGESLMVAGWVFTNSHGNDFSFSDGAFAMVMALSLGLYCAVIVADMVFSDQFKHNTLKNEISFGLPRSRIYFGKLIVACVTAVGISLILVIYYLGLCRLLLPAGEADLETVKGIGFCLLAALPLWLGAMALSIALFFLLKSNTLAAILSVIILLAVPNVWYALASIVSEHFWHLYRGMLSTPFDQILDAIYDWKFFRTCLAIGAGWFAATTVIGFLSFRKKEIS